MTGWSTSMPEIRFAAGLENDGQGVEITSIELGNLKPGAKANIDKMNFNVIFTVGSSACGACLSVQNNCCEIALSPAIQSSGIAYDNVCYR
jgi:hypothetical protein